MTNTETKNSSLIDINAGSGIAKLLIFISWITIISTIGIILYELFPSLNKPEASRMPDGTIILYLGISGMLGFLFMQAIGRILQHLIALRHSDQ